VDWTGIKKRINEMVDLSVCPEVVDEDTKETRPARISIPNSMKKLDLDAWLEFFAHHQELYSSTPTWEEGMIFVPTAKARALQVFRGQFVHALLVVTLTSSKRGFNFKQWREGVCFQCAG
jgi:hypothetical protein